MHEHHARLVWRTSLQEEIHPPTPPKGSRLGGGGQRGREGDPPGRTADSQAGDKHFHGCLECGSGGLEEIPPVNFLWGSLQREDAGSKARIGPPASPRRDGPSSTVGRRELQLPRRQQRDATGLGKRTPDGYAQRRG